MKRPIIAIALFSSTALACSQETKPDEGRCADCPGDASMDAIDGGSQTGSKDGGDGTDTDSALNPGSDAGEDTGMMWQSGPIRPKRYRLADPEVKLAPCAGGGNGSVDAHEVLMGQTHLTPRDWPFQTVSANRPLTVAIAASGTGAAPSFLLKIQNGSDELDVCLEGPANLPEDVRDLEQSLFRATIPASWVVPGMSVQVTGAGIDETLSPVVKPENGLTLYYLQAHLFGAGDPGEPPSDAMWTEFLARLPVSFLDVGVNPLGVWKPSKLLVSQRDDGRTPTGTTTSHPPIMVNENPHCSEADKSNGTCTPHSGYGLMSAVLSHLDPLREANGVSSSSTWYADLAVSLGGGLAGGQRGTGDNAGLVMNHEIGHAWGFPHWALDHTDYPYEGVQRERGGFGDRWAIDQARDLLLSPICEGKERQSPMQRAGSCVPDGSWFDPFSDYESMRLLRMNLGAREHESGVVAYHGGSLDSLERAFSLPRQDGRPHMEFHPDKAGFVLQRYNEDTNAFEDHEPEDWARVVSAEVPVTMFSGALIVGGESFFEGPLSYVGNVLGHLDPTVPEDYAYIYAHRSTDFRWARDLVLRFTLDDESSFERLYSAEAELRDDGDLIRFAFNLPRDVGTRVEKLEVMSRPLGHYSESSRLSDTDSAENYLQNAEVLATWER